MTANPITEPFQRKPETCGGCGLQHTKVEAGGIWACPNPLCKATGAMRHRVGLKSYRETTDGHTVDPTEMVTIGMQKAVETGDLDIIAAAGRMVPWWLDQKEDGAQ